jgi:hypothetical protein
LAVRAGCWSSVARITTMTPRRTILKIARPRITDIAAAEERNPRILSSAVFELREQRY